MFKKKIIINISESYILLENKKVCKNWFELINTQFLITEVITKCKDKNIIILTSDNITINTEQYLNFFLQHNLTVKKIYRHKKVIYKNKTKFPKQYFSKIIILNLMLFNLLLYFSFLENQKLNKRLKHLDLTLTKQLFKYNKKNSNILDPLNEMLTVIKTNNCIIESISFKQNNTLSSVVISPKNSLHNFDTTKFEINTLLNTKIGGMYEIKLKY